MNIQIKVTEQYFPVVLFIMLYKVVLTIESLHLILKCDHSNVSSAVYYSVQGGSTSSLCIKLKRVTIEIKATEQYFPVVLFIMLYKVVLLLSLWMKSQG